MEGLLYGANILYLISYAVRDILWLRILTVVAASILIAYFWLLPEPLYTVVYWNLLFTGINIYWVTRLMLERRPVCADGTRPAALPACLSLPDTKGDEKTAQAWNLEERCARHMLYPPGAGTGQSDGNLRRSG